MEIKDTFLLLTSKTYPNAKETLVDYKEISNIVQSLCKHTLKKDTYGNRYVNIPLSNGEQSSVMFTCHLDTATSADSKVNHVFDGNFIKTDGKSILGADDKAGTAIMLHMIENNVPGLYYFFLGEEVGCLGSKDLASKHTINKNPFIKKVISFDRRKTDDVITYQNHRKRCCSDVFAKKLSEQLNLHSKKIDVKDSAEFKYAPCEDGVMTDSAQFMTIYSECTNISVGYQNEHRMDEKQDIVHLEKLAKTCVLVEWETLPAERDPSKVETKYVHNHYSEYGDHYGHGHYGHGGFHGNNTNTNRHNITNPNTEKKPVLVEDIWIDSKSKSIFKLVFNKTDNVYTKFDTNLDEIELEKEYILEHLSLLLNADILINSWDGVKLVFSKKLPIGESGHILQKAEPLNRIDLEEAIPFLRRFSLELEERRKEIKEIEDKINDPEFVEEYVNTINRFIDAKN